ncbi:hypothetical protein GCM10007870_25670 [Gluconobacter kondonii]|uniref:Uncharacterized protein n=1 Tax=Gluconobacter kondonii TaxID=941463 RepID=A0ABQ5WWH5_9PROT|nr:hypothetical protein GCM10007870_25670 [Gluconobacter kondonii]
MKSRIIGVSVLLDAQEVRHKAPRLGKRLTRSQARCQRHRIDGRERLAVVLRRVHNKRAIGEVMIRLAELEALGAPEGKPQGEEAAHGQDSREASGQDVLHAPATARRKDDGVREAAGPVPANREGLKDER